MAEKMDKQHLLISGYCRLKSNDMNIIDGIILIIFEYQKKYARWSNEYKGDKIGLSEDDTKATCVEDDGHSVRADFAINRGENVSWELECEITNTWANFYGVISSEIENFEVTPYDGYVDQCYNCYGVDDAEDQIYEGFDNVRSSWPKPAFPANELFRIRFIADWREKQCKLSIWYNDKKLNENQDDYTMLLPELGDEYVWYPFVSPYDKGSYCVIRYS